MSKTLQDAARDAVTEWRLHGSLTDSCRRLEAALAAEQQQPEMVTRHEANEWADMATNGIQWLKNVRDGHSTVEHALVEMESNLQRIRAEFSSKQPTRAELDAAYEIDIRNLHRQIDELVEFVESAIHEIEWRTGKFDVDKARALLARMDGGK